MKRLFVGLLILSKEIMKFSMRRIIGEQLQIIRPVIIFNPVNMMNYSYRCYKSTNQFLHNQMRTADVSLFIRTRMRGLFNKNVTFRSFCNSAFPIITFFHSLGKTNFFTMLRSEFSAFSCSTKVLPPFFRKWWAFLAKMSKTYFFLPFFRFYSTLSIFTFPNITTLFRTAFSSLKFRWMSYKFILTNNTFFKHCFFSFLFIIAFNIISCQINNIYAADQWNKGSPAGTDSPATLDNNIQINNNAIDRALSNYREGCKISYSSASAINVAAGELVLSDSTGSTRRFRSNTSSTSVGWADLDTGSEAASTIYYLYGVADTDVTTFTFKISTSSSAPSGVTYYKRLGYFTNDASSNITQIVNDNDTAEVSYVKGQGNYYKIEGGSASLANGGSATFATTFASTPYLAIVANSGGTGIITSISALSTTGFTFYTNGAGSYTVYYIVIGQVLAQ